jgi:hypothetical protein
MIEDSQSYYVRRQGRVEGPWPITKLRAEIGLRKLGRHHELSTDGANWQRAGDVEGLFVSVATRKRVGRPTPASSASPQVEAARGDEEEIELELDAQPAVGRAVAWHYSVDDRQFGPVGDDEIIFGIEAGRLPLDTLVWREGYADWVTVEEVPELMARIDNSWRNSATSYTAATQFAAPSAERLRYPSYALWGGVITLLLSWIPFVGFAGLLPIVFGILGISEANSMDGNARGRGGAIAGIMLGMASMALAAIELTVIGFVLWQKLVD